MTIQDIALNAFYPTQSSPMLGYQAPAVATESANTQNRLLIYNMIIEVIREEDQQRGGQFLERLLEGPQAAWDQWMDRIRSVVDIWDLDKVSDELLPYVKNILGWTSKYDGITSRLNSLALRRLVQASAAFWQRRAPEDEILNLIAIATDARVKIQNWFDLRTILDEMALDYRLDPSDPHMLEDEDSGRYQVRIVDDGTLDRELVRQLIRLTRPINERVDILYLRFLDQFLTADDLSQWTVDAGTVVVANGVLAMTNSGAAASARVTVDLAEDIESCVITCKIKGTSNVSGDEFGIRFCVQSSSNYYQISLDTVDNEMRLYKVVGGVPTMLSDTDFAAIPGFELTNDYHALKLELIISATTTTIQAFIDGVNCLNDSDTTYLQGSAGVFHDSGATCTVDEFEIFLTPADVDSIGINS